ncbi:hypothetical protein [Fibrobacter succinogenes]|uniref:hypothetical protein n=1 Tax=Fibrobacter succinogenes TaxID=833 RepID=UPI0015685C72|nr:hypothetical protein [Fibrobacter succinogenes]
MINIKRASIAIVILLFALCGNVFAEQSASTQTKTRYLQISTNPSTVDLYTGLIFPDFASKPNYTSPAFIPVPDGKDSIIVSFFHPNYADTTINIALSPNDTSFIIVALKQTYDDERIERNQDLLKHRNRRILGGYLKWASIAPFAISGISAIISLYNISKANDHKRAMENTRFVNEKYDEHMRDFKDHKSSAKTAKTVSGIFFATGIAFLTAGFVLSF